MNLNGFTNLAVEKTFAMVVSTRLLSKQMIVSVPIAELQFLIPVRYRVAFSQIGMKLY
jgi:hypothetical protein